MKNHFIFPYTGNKRNEAKGFLENINLENKKNIIEPFCGSSALSFSIWLEHGDKFNYYLNDNDKKLIEVYNILKNENIEDIEKEITERISTINNKQEWNETFKSDYDIYYFILFKKYSRMNRLGFYPNDFNTRKKNDFKITKETKEFIEFLKNPYVHITNNGWFDLFDEYKNDEQALFIFDPPYVNTCNDFYSDRNLNIYEYFHNHKIESFESHIYLILEDIWMIRLLFNNNKILLQYEKKYETSKRKTQHIIIYNQ